MLCMRIYVNQNIRIGILKGTAFIYLKVCAHRVEFLGYGREYHWNHRFCYWYCTLLISMNNEIPNK